MHGEHAVQCMKFVKIFKSNGMWHTEESTSIMQCDAEKVAAWKEAMKCIDTDVIESQSEMLQEDRGRVDTIILPLTSNVGNAGVAAMNTEDTFRPSVAVDISHLCVDQK